MISRVRDRLLSAAASLRFRLRALIKRRQLDHDLDDELRHHLELRAELEAGRGLTAAEAHRAARVRFGSVDRLREDARDVSRFVVLAGFLDDATRGVRLLRRQPVFAGVTTAILSLGIGINVWIFGAMTTLLFRPMPGIADPGRLVAIGRSENGAGFDTQSYPNALSIRQRNTALEDLAVYSDITLGVDASGETARVRGQLVSANYFRVIGSAMARGRAFADADDRPGTRAVVVSDAFRKRTFGPAAGAVGETIHVNRATVEVIGVAPEDFRGLDGSGAPVDIWLPIGAMDAIGLRSGVAGDPLTNRAATWLGLLGRLKADVSIGTARVSLRRLGEQLAAEFPDDNAGRGIAVEPLGGVAPGARDDVWRDWALLNGLSAVVLLVVCFNVGNMMLARASARRQEMALRLSLGAGRLRLVRQLLAEHTVLMIAGAAGGGLVAWWAALAARSVVPGGFVPLPAGGLGADWRVFAFTAAVTLASGAVFCLPPAWAVARTSVVTQVASGRGQRVTSPARLRTLFAVLQIALSLGLLISAGLLTRSLRNATAVDLGFRPDGVVTAYYDLEAAGYAPAEGARVHGRLLERLRQWPAVESAALGQHAPLQGSSLGLPIQVVENGTPGRAQLVRMNVIAPGFLRTLRTPVRRGREFEDADDGSATPVALVNEACLHQCFGGADPLGRRILVFRETSPREIVGVVADSKYSQPLETVRPTIYVPVAQRYAPRMAIIIRTASPAAVARELPDEVRHLDTALPVYDVRTLDDRMRLALWEPRLMSGLVAGFGLLTLVLAVLGVYGVIAQATTQRAPEIAVRMALGARPGQILRLVTRQGLSLVAIGTVLGLVLAIGASGLLETFLYGVAPLDPISFASGTAVLSVATLCGCLLPACRAAVANPAQVLRQ